MSITAAREILRDRSRQEEDDNHRRRDPEWTIEIRVAIKDIKEVCPRVYGREASVQHGGGIDVKELGVERKGPEVTLRGRGSASTLGLAVAGGKEGC